VKKIVGNRLGALAPVLHSWRHQRLIFIFLKFSADSRVHRRKIFSN